MPADPAKHLDYAKDSVAQIITLSSGVLAISLTFSNNWISSAKDTNTAWLKASWIALVLTLFLGSWAMLALVGIARTGKADVGTFSFRLPWMLEILSFVVGLLLLFIFGWITVND